MKLESIFRRFMVFYNKAISDPSIRKPIAWTLYKLWRWADLHEKPRKVI